MLKSIQRLGDDPRDYDGVFQRIDTLCVGASDLKPDPVDASTNPTQFHQDFKPWKIYPKPPLPRLPPKNAEGVSLSEDEVEADFRFEECEIPEEHSWTFRLDDGVFQVFGSLEGKSKFSSTATSYRRLIK
jgi:AMP deaminase